MPPENTEAGLRDSPVGFEQEAIIPEARITNVAPWPRGALAKAYRRSDKEWECIEAAATAAQGRPSWGERVIRGLGLAGL